MPAFKASGREWLIKLDAPLIKDVRKDLDIDLLDDGAFERLADDPISLVDVLWVLCRAQANGLTSEQFGQGLADGDLIDEATKALIEARLSFIPARKRLLLRSLAEKRAALNDKAMDLAITKINDPNLEAKMLAKLEQDLTNALTSFDSATSTPASSASPPKDEPSPICG